MRETQIIGLRPEAKKFIEENANKVSRKCPTCGCGSVMIVEEKDYKDARGLGMFGDGPMLKEYKLKDGKVAKEIVQASPWSGGPCIFLCLEVGGKRMFEWSDDDIAHA